MGKDLTGSPTSKYNCRHRGDKPPNGDLLLLLVFGLNQHYFFHIAERRVVSVVSDGGCQGLVNHALCIVDGDLK